MNMNKTHERGGPPFQLPLLPASATGTGTATAAAFGFRLLLQFQLQLQLRSVRFLFHPLLMALPPLPPTDHVGCWLLLDWRRLCHCHSATATSTLPPQLLLHARLHFITEIFVFCFRLPIFLGEGGFL